MSRRRDQHRRRHRRERIAEADQQVDTSMPIPSHARTYSYVARGVTFAFSIDDRELITVDEPLTADNARSQLFAGVLGIAPASS